MDSLLLIYFKYAIVYVISFGSVISQCYDTYDHPLLVGWMVGDSILEGNTFCISAYDKQELRPDLRIDKDIYRGNIAP